MRYAAFIVGLLGVLATGYLAYSWTTDVLKNKDEVAKKKAEIDQTRPIIEAMGDLNARLALAQFDIVYAEFSAARAWPLVLGAFGLGIAGCVLVLRGRGLIAALLMFLAFILPAIFHVVALIFTGLFLLGAILCLFVRRRQPAPAQAPAPAPIRTPGRPAHR